MRPHASTRRGDEVPGQSGGYGDGSGVSVTRLPQLIGSRLTQLGWTWTGRVVCLSCSFSAVQDRAFRRVGCDQRLNGRSAVVCHCEVWQFETDYPVNFQTSEKRKLSKVEMCCFRKESVLILGRMSK